MSDFAEWLRAAAREAATDNTGAVSSVFAEEPVSLTIFVQDKAFLGNPPLSPVQYDAVRHIERVYYPITYPLLAQEFDASKKPGRLAVGAVSAWRDEPYWSQPTRMINFATLQWGKGSLSPLSEIYNSRTGEWVKVKDWNQQDLVASVYPADGRVFATEGSTAFREGHGSMYRVRTSKGFECEVWEGHRFLTWARRRWPSGARVAAWSEARGADWARLWDMQVGDPIAVSSVVPEPTEPVAQPDHEVELAAMLIANGSLTGTNYGAFTANADATLTQQRAAELFRAFPETDVKSYLDQSGGSRRWRVLPKQLGTNRHSAAVRAALERWGLSGCAAADKRVPAVFFRVPNRQVALFVSRLIDTDGWVSFSNTPEIGYSTISRGLAQDVQHLLLRLGVLAELKEKKTTCQNCRAGDPEHGTEHLSYQVRVRDAVGLAQLAGQLTLLDKEPQRQRLLDWVVAREGRRVRARHGDLVWDKIESIEYLGEDEYWTLSVDGPASYIGANGTIHHNSGKDHVARLASMRIAYLLMCLHSPQEYYGMPEQDTIHLLNVASSSAQAQQAFFMPIVRAVKRGWFADKCQPRQNVISFAKNVEAVSGHSDAESQEGLNLMLGTADEIDAFKSKKEMSFRRGTSPREPTKSAEGILNMMRTSGSTRFPEVFKQVRISYPRYLGSTIQQLTDEARKDIEANGPDSRHYVSGPLATWHVNPRVPGREAFAGDYREDPILARSKYECKPARAVNPYFRNHQAVDACIVRVEVPPVEVSYTIETAGASRVWVPQYTFARDFFPVRGAIYAMHADLAVSGDRAGIALAHVVKWTEHEVVAVDEDEATHPVRHIRPHVKADFVFSYTSDTSVDPPREIQIRWARQLAFELIRRGFNIKRFSFDHFQSVDSMQILETRGIDTEKVSTDLHEDPWRNLRDLMYEGRVSFPGPSIVDEANPPPFLLRDELLSLTRMPNGRINHPSDGSKDEADALACAVLGAIAVGGSEEEAGDRAYYSAPEFSVGSTFPMPAGVNMRQLWETELPSPF